MYRKQTCDFIAGRLTNHKYSACITLPQRSVLVTNSCLPLTLILKSNFTQRQCFNCFYKRKLHGLWRAIFNHLTGQLFFFRNLESFDTVRCYTFEMSTFSNPRHVCYLAHFQSTVIRYHFWGGHLIWSATAMFVLARRTARLNSVTQYYVVVNERGDSPRVKSSSVLISVGLRSFKWKYWFT